MQVFANLSAFVLCLPRLQSLQGHKDLTAFFNVLVRIRAAVFHAECAKSTPASLTRASERTTTIEVKESLTTARASQRKDLVDDMLLGVL